MARSQASRPDYTTSPGKGTNVSLSYDDEFYLSVNVFSITILIVDTLNKT